MALKYIEGKKKPILVYAFLEIGIGVTALLVPQILKLLDSIYPLIYEYVTSYVWLLVLTKVVLSLLVLFVPTFLMGGTLPVLSKLFVNRPKESGRQVGILYAINTIGAAIGCFIAGFFLIELFGIAKTIQLVAAVNFLLGIASFALSVYHEQKPDLETANIENAKRAVNDSSSYGKMRPFYSILILIGFSLAGFVSLSYEVLWTRLLVFKLKMTIYAFSIMLTTFLAGIAVGSIVVAIIEKYNLIKSHSRALGVVQSLIGLTGLFTIVLFGQIGSIPLFDIIGSFKSSISWEKLIFTEVLLSGMIMIVPTTFMGMTFPLVSRIFTKNVKIVGKTIGSIYSVNTVGGILGSCLTGFILVKTLGTQKSIILVSLIALTIGTTIVLLNRQGMNESKNPKSLSIIFPAIAWSIAVGLVAWLPKDMIFKYYNIYEEQSFQDVQIVYANEGIEGITTVHEYPGGFKGISTSSVNVAGTHYTHRTTQKLQAHIPMLVHPNPREVLQVGFGSGETSHLVTTYDIEQLDLVEISSEVIDTATEYFKDINKDVANHPKFNPIIMDGANYISLAEKKYDVIMNDASWPGYTGCSALYSKDYFEEARKLLKPGGIMTSWFPITEGEDFKILLKTFHSVFPHVSVWSAMTHVNKHTLVVGSLDPIEIDAQDFLRRFKQYAQNDLESVDLDNPIFFLDAYQMDETVLGNLLDSVPTHTIDHPILEFTERKKDPVENISAYSILTENNTSITPYLKNVTNVYIGGKNILRSLESTRDATKLVMTGYIRVIGSGEYQPRYESEFKEALIIEPKHPGANHFFFRMFNIHLALAENYARNQDHKNATYCYDLAFKEINFYISLRPDSAKAYHNRGLVTLSGGEYLGLEAKESLNKAQEDFSKALTQSPQYALENDIGALIDRIDDLLQQ